ncbi:16S rRNA (guanine(527)-N(7))-methyltransferase RsmG [Tsuneonella sp. SYSU-LHT278]|uniref:16S rRNA (guanine(527)-N(7))-methyltransferase RsmG n=1 Tax=Tsuneonella sediminis TaxID=3416089 RepID=UPI003F79D9C7
MILRTEEESRAYVAERCEPEAMARLEEFSAMLQTENERQNLVSAASIDCLWRRHIADSAQLLDLAPAVPRGTWMDLGSGAGFPGLVIAIMRPSFHVELVESRRLRTDWLARCVDALELENCDVLAGRVETVTDHKAAVISARAFAPLSKTVAVARRFSTADTVWLLPKGRSAAQEVEQLPRSMHAMFHVEQSVSAADAGILTAQITEKAGR